MSVSQTKPALEVEHLGNLGQNFVEWTLQAFHSSWGGYTPYVGYDRRETNERNE
jgi:hypothetical protein